MAGQHGVLADVAGAILDGSPVDWASAESGAGEAERPLLPHLRLIAGVADFSRRLPQPDAVTAARTGPVAVVRAPQEQWGHLRVLERIGRGAFGEVYRAWDTRLDREVALKLMAAGAIDGGKRATTIIEEGRLLARVRHPNVVTIYGAERIGDRVGLWMEFVKGRTLEQTLEQGHLFTESEAIDIGVQLCHATAAVHEAGLVHRDIKAHNVMLADDQRVVLMDFGTGHELGDGPVAALAGTPLYLAPELLSGGEATVRSDVYGIGVLLYHLLTGAYPVQARTMGELQSAHARGDRIDLKAARPTLPPRLVRVIGQAIDPDPQRRHQNAVTLGADFSALKPRPRVVPLAYAAGIAAALVLAVWIAADIRGRQTQGPSSRPVAAAVTGSAAFSPATRPIIAVLPLKNLSDEPDSEFFVDGLTDELIRNLAVIEGLDVRSQTSSFAFKDKPRNLREIGDQLGANLVVEGSVLRSGNHLRINAQLVQVAGDVPMWSEKFDRELKDVFAIQDEIARAIVNRLRLTLGRGQRRYDTNIEAYELFLEARAMVTRRGAVSAHKAAALFEQVIEKDAAFAPAYAGLADAYGFMSMEIPAPSITPELALERMRPAALKALALDPLLPEGHAAMGLLYSRERDWANAQKSFERAIELNPTLTASYTSYSSSTLIPLGKTGDAERLVLTAMAHDPLSPNARRELAALQILGARYEEAIENLRRIEAVEPGFPFVDLYLARALSLAGRLTEAMPLWEKRKHEPGSQHWMAYALVRAGRRAEVERIAATHDHPYRLAIFYTALGDHDRALEALNRAADIVPQRVVLLVRYPEMLPLRGDPRFAAICKKLGLPAS